MGPTLSDSLPPVAPLQRIVGAPGDVLGALRVLPDIARHTAAMARHTAAMAKATQSLPTVEEKISEVAEATDVLPPMEDRMAKIRSEEHTSELQSPVHLVC